MPSRERERLLARQRYERRVARRTALRVRRRRRLTRLAAAVGVVALLAGTALVAWRLWPSAADRRSDQAIDRGGESGARSAATCAFPRLGRAARDVGTPPRRPAEARAAYVATIETNRGEITVQLLAERAPCTVASFRHLAERGFFDDTPCHRLTTGPGLFVLQCGDPTGTGRGGPGYSLEDENLQAFGSGRSVTYPAGTVAMANSGRPGTSGSQFFLVYRDSRLAPAYTPFGRVTSGLDIVEKVAAAGAAPGEKPRQPVQVRDVRVLRRR